MEEAWYIDDEIAYDILNRNGLAREFRARPGETALDRMRAETPWFEDGDPFHPTRLEMGQFYRRIARPLFGARDGDRSWCPSLNLEPVVVAGSHGQALSLLRQLERICQTVHPCPKNLCTFGHDIRNLLILACTEVEAQWRGVLTSNGAQKKSFSTKEYVNLANIMRLREFAVSFPSFPELEPIYPFKGWGLGSNPTADLLWYADYNAVKHNREQEFERANLDGVFQALSAVAVMLVAQYGEYGLGYRSDLSRFFIISQKPTWPSFESYIPNQSLSISNWSHDLFAPINHSDLEVLKDK
jgi:hypothetical protein